MRKKVLCIGAAHLDKVFTFLVEPYELGELPATSEDILGGCVYNSAEAISRLGADVRFMTLMGDDVAGAKVQNGLKSLGIDTSGIVVSNTVSTGTYVSFHRPSGELYVAAADLDVYSHFSQSMIARALQDQPKCDAWVFDTEWRKEVFEYIAHLEDTSDIYIVLTSTFKSTNCLPIINGKTKGIFGNASEILAIGGPSGRGDEGLWDAMSWIHKQGVSLVCATRGGQDAFLLVDGVRHVMPVFCADVQCVQGAGDMVAGAMIFKLTQGASPEVALRYGMAAGALRVEKRLITQEALEDVLANREPRS